MNDFKKNFKKPGGFSRPSFGGNSGPRRTGGGRDFNGSTETFKTSCSKCNAACEVPFRPNGKKPVFCKNCFVRDDSRDTRDFRPSGNSFEKRSYGNDRPERAFAPKPQAPVEDPRIGAMQRELTVVHEKLDTLIQSLESAAYSSILATSGARDESPAKPVKAVKKAPAKKAAPKKAAKKTAKKK